MNTSAVQQKLNKKRTTVEDPHYQQICDCRYKKQTKKFVVCSFTETRGFMEIHTVK